MEPISSVDPMCATWIMLSLIGVMLLIPVLEKIPVLGKVISLRWSLVVVTTVLMVGTVINFSHLSDSVRMAVIVGGIILAALFILARSIEKWLYHGWAFKAEKIEGDLHEKKLTIEGMEIGGKKVEKQSPEGDKKDSHSVPDNESCNGLKGLAEREQQN